MLQTNLWAKFPAALHEKLLLMTQQMELTMPIGSGKEEGRSLVPCLLPDAAPKEFRPSDWQPGLVGGQLCTFREYHFEFLPAGSFSRIQIRLQDMNDLLSDLMLWKCGIMLGRNGHRAAIVVDAKTRIVRATVKGDMPHSLLEVISETVASLTATYHGVKISYWVPCEASVKQRLPFIHMFDVDNTVRKALRQGVSYLQNPITFSQTPVSSLLCDVPAETDAEFVAQHRAQLNFIEEIRARTAQPICLLTGEDAGGSLKQAVVDGIRAAGQEYSWNASSALMTGEARLAAVDGAEMVVALVTPSFSADRAAFALLEYATKAGKETLLVTAADTPALDGVAFGESVCGSDESFAQKFQQQVSSALSVTGFDGVLSYSWENSLRHVRDGNVPHHTGAVDPLAVSAALKAEGVQLWVDTEHVGGDDPQVHFNHLSTGLRRANFLLACISDEYAMSPQCGMELRLANELGVAVVAVIVGAPAHVGIQPPWRSSELSSLVSEKKTFFDLRNAESFDRVVQDLSAHLQGLARSSPARRNSRDRANTSEILEQACIEGLSSIRRLFIRRASVLSSLEAQFDDDVLTPRLIFVEWKAAESPLSVSEDVTDFATIDQIQDETFVLRVLTEDQFGWHVSSHSGYKVTLTEDRTNLSDGMCALAMLIPWMKLLLSVLERVDPVMLGITPAQISFWRRIATGRDKGSQLLAESYGTIRSLYCAVMKDGQNSNLAEKTASNKQIYMVEKDPPLPPPAGDVCVVKASDSNHNEPQHVVADRLHRGIRAGDMVAVTDLLQSGTHAKLASDANSSVMPLHRAALQGIEMTEAVLEHLQTDSDAIDSSVLNAVTKYGYTAYMLACSRGMHGVVDRMVKLGCNTKVENSNGQTGVDLAIQHAKVRGSVAKLDLDGDRKLSPEEIQKALTDRTEASRKVVEILANFASDGHVDLADEFRRRDRQPMESNLQDDLMIPFERLEFWALEPFENFERKAEGAFGSIDLVDNLFPPICSKGMVCSTVILKSAKVSGASDTDLDDGEKEDDNVLALSSEICALATLDHPNIVKILGFTFGLSSGSVGGRKEWMLLLEKCDCDLALLIKEDGSLDVLHLALGMASGLDYIHQQDLRHLVSHPSTTNLPVFAITDSPMCLLTGPQAGKRPNPARRRWRIHRVDRRLRHG